MSAVNGLRVSINEAGNRQHSRSILLGDLIDHYKHTEFCDRSEWYSEATKVIYAEFLNISSQQAGPSEPNINPTLRAISDISN